jgi:hypothetical protein
MPPRALLKKLPFLGLLTQPRAHHGGRCLSETKERQNEWQNRKQEVAITGFQNSSASLSETFVELLIETKPNVTKHTKM